MSPRWVALYVGCAVLGGFLGASAHADADEVDQRYAPTTRGPRASYATEQVQRWRPLVASYEGWNIERALRVIACESEGDPNAENPTSGALGLMQLMPSWRPLAVRLFDSRFLVNPWTNIGTAHHLWRAGGGRFGSRIGWQASQPCWDID